jgi:hypothetical protein
MRACASDSAARRAARSDSSIAVNVSTEEFYLLTTGIERRQQDALMPHRAIFVLLIEDRADSRLRSMVARAFCAVPDTDINYRLGKKLCP